MKMVLLSAIAVLCLVAAVWAEEPIPGPHPLHLAQDPATAPLGWRCSGTVTTFGASANGEPWLTGCFWEFFGDVKFDLLIHNVTRDSPAVVPITGVNALVSSWLHYSTAYPCKNNTVRSLTAADRAAAAGRHCSSSLPTHMLPIWLPMAASAAQASTAPGAAALPAGLVPLQALLNAHKFMLYATQAPALGPRENKYARDLTTNVTIPVAYPGAAVGAAVAAAAAGAAQFNPAAGWANAAAARGSLTVPPNSNWTGASTGLTRAVYINVMLDCAAAGAGCQNRGAMAHVWRWEHGVWRRDSAQPVQLLAAAALGPNSRPSPWCDPACTEANGLALRATVPMPELLLPSHLNFDATNGRMLGVDTSRAPAITAVLPGAELLVSLLSSPPAGQALAWATMNFTQPLPSLPPHVDVTNGSMGQLAASHLRFLASPTGVQSLATGEHHTCALVLTGKIWCWGRGDELQLGHAVTKQQTDAGPIGIGHVQLPAKAVAVSAGEAHTCAILVNASVICWGRASSGQLGIAGAASSLPVPATESRVAPLPLAVTHVAAGSNRTCATTVAGTVYCWGQSSSTTPLGYVGEMGNIVLTSTPTAMALPWLAVSTVVTQDAWCAVTSLGSMCCVGSNLGGSLGIDGSDRNRTAYPAQALPVLGADGSTLAQLVVLAEAGPSHIILVRGDNEMLSIGWDDSQHWLALGHKLSASSDVTRAHLPYRLDLGWPARGRVMHVGAGRRFGCAAWEDGEVTCWGDETDNRRSTAQINTGYWQQFPERIPVITTSSTVLQLAAGGAHTCTIVRARYAVRCWGLDDANNELGIDRYSSGFTSSTASTLPLQVSVGVALLVNIPPAAAITAHTVVTSIDSIDPPATVNSIHAGANMMALQFSIGTATCYGAVVFLNLASGPAPAFSAHLSSVGMSYVLEAATSWMQHFCVVVDNKYAEYPSKTGLRCGGVNTWGQLLNADQTFVTKLRYNSDIAPVQHDVMNVAAGERFTVATVNPYGPALPAPLLISGGTQEYIGRGVGADDYSYLVGSPVFLNHTADPAFSQPWVHQVQTGLYHTCVLVELAIGLPSPNPTLFMRCFGLNSAGQCGYKFGTGGADLIDGPSLQSVPDGNPNVQLGAQPVQVWAGSSVTCARLATGSIRCFGSNKNYLLGAGVADAVRPYTTGPVDYDPIDFGTEYVLEMGIGFQATCALLRGGNVKCWGLNMQGQAGYGDTTPRGHTPGTVPRLLPYVAIPEPVVAIAMGGTHSTALTVSGSVYSWGVDSYLALGLPGLYMSMTPTESPAVLRMAALNLPGRRLPDRAAPNETAPGLVIRSRVRAVLPQAIHSLPTLGRTLYFAESGGSSIRAWPFGFERTAASFTAWSGPGEGISNSNSCPFDWTHIGSSTAVGCVWPDPHWYIGGRTQILSVTPSFIPTQGGALQLHGYFAELFAAGSTADVALVNNAVCAGFAVRTPTLAECTAPAGSGANHTVWLAHSAPSTGAVYLAHAISYLSPSIVRVAPSRELNPFGGTAITISGSSFGAPGACVSARCQPLQVMLDGVPCMADPAQHDHWQISCSAPPFTTGQSAALQVCVDGQCTEFEQRLAYALASILLVSVVNSNGTRVSANPAVMQWGPSASKLYRLRVDGSYLGADLHQPLQGMLNGKLPVACYVQSNATMLQQVALCDPISAAALLGALQTPGTASSMSAQLCLNIANASICTGTGDAAVIRIQGNLSIDSVSPSELPQVPLPGDRVTINGENFGVVAADVEAVLIGGQACTAVERVASNILRAAIPPGIGPNKALELRLSTGDIALAPKAFSYRSPVYSAVQPPVVFESASSTATQDFVVFGEHLGANTSGLQISAMLIGGANCTNIVWLNASAVACLGMPLREVQSASVQVSVAGIPALLPATQALQQPFSYVPKPTITGVRPQALNTDSFTTLQIDGANFEVLAAGQRLSAVVGASIAGLPCVNLTVQSSSQLTCRAPPGVGASVPLRLTGRGGARSQATLLQYQIAQLMSAAPSTMACHPTRVYSLSVQGMFFGVDAALIAVQAGGAACPNVALSRLPASDGSKVISCGPLPAALLVPGSSALVVNVSGQVATDSSGLLSVQPRPVLVGASVEDQAKLLLSLVGQHFGEDGSDIVRVTVGGNECVQVAWASSNRLTCVASALNTEPQRVVIATYAGQSAEPVFIAIPQAQTPVGELSAATAQRTFSEAGADTAHVHWTWCPTAGQSAAVLPTDFQVEVARVADAAGNPALADVQVSQISVSGMNVTATATCYACSAPVQFLRSTPYVARVQALNRAGSTVSPAVSGPWSQPLLAQCISGTYDPTQVSLPDRACQACPQGAVCSGGDEQSVEAQAGFYRLPWSSGAGSYTACVPAFKCQSPSTAANDSAAAGSSAGPCALGYTGLLCGNCAPGYAPTPAGTCGVCLASGTSVFLLCLMGLLTLCVVVVLIRGQIVSRHAGKKSHSVMKRVLLSHFQVVTLLLQFDMEFPSPTKETLISMDATSSMSDSAFSPECASATGGRPGDIRPFHLRSLLSAMLPLVMLATICLGLALLYWKQERRAASGAAGRAELRRRLTVAAIGVLYLFYTTSSRTAFKQFSCTTIRGVDGSDSAERLSADLQLACNASETLQWQLTLGLPILLLYTLGFPLAVFATLRRHKDSLHTDNDLRRTYGLVFSGYKPERWYHEAIVLLRKALAALAVVFTQVKGVNMQAFSLLVVLFGATIVQIYTRPFIERSHNMLEEAGLGISMASILGALFVEDPGTTQAGKVVVSTFIALSNIVFVAILVKGIAQGFADQWGIRAAAQRTLHTRRKTLAKSVRSMLERHGVATEPVQTCQPGQSSPACENTGSVEMVATGAALAGVNPLASRSTPTPASAAQAWGTSKQPRHKGSSEANDASAGSPVAGRSPEPLTLPVQAVAQPAKRAGPTSSSASQAIQRRRSSRLWLLQKRSAEQSRQTDAGLPAALPALAESAFYNPLRTSAHGPLDSSGSQSSARPRP